MGKKIITTEEYTCDRCRVKLNSKAPVVYNQVGFAEISYKESVGGKDAFGNWGGSSSDGELYLCLKCRSDFIKFIGNKDVESRESWNTDM